MRTLWSWLLALDRILRGESTRVADLRDGAIEIPVLGISVVLVALGMLYGVCMGTYAVVNHGRGVQMLASTVKVPALFVLTLAVTLPSLYVFNALVGSRLSARSVIRLFIAALAVNLAVLSSLGPIVAFFSINTTSYSFMVLLNVLVFAVSGFLGLAFLLQTLRRLSIAPHSPPRLPIANAPSVPADSAGESPGGAIEAEVIETGKLAEPGPLETVEGHMFGRHVRAVFACWMLLFGVVGAQMGWVLRPFVGSPDLPFEWFRPRSSNFFEAVWNSIQSLLG